MKENNLTRMVKEMGLIDTVADFNSKALVKEVSSPYPLYNGYLEAGLNLLDSPEVDGVTKDSFNACATSVHAANCNFRLNASLQAYCDYIQLITKDRIISIGLYETLHCIVDTMVNLLYSGDLFALGAIDEKNVYNFVFSFSSVIFNETVDFLYRYRITLTDKLYHDLTMANIIYSETLRNDILTLLNDYKDCYHPYFEYRTNDDMPF